MELKSTQFGPNCALHPEVSIPQASKKKRGEKWKAQRGGLTNFLQGSKKRSEGANHGG